MVRQRINRQIYGKIEDREEIYGKIEDREEIYWQIEDREVDIWVDGGQGGIWVDRGQGGRYTGRQRIGRQIISADLCTTVQCVESICKHSRSLLSIKQPLLMFIVSVDSYTLYSYRERLFLKFWWKTFLYRLKF